MQKAVLLIVVLSCRLAGYSQVTDSVKDMRDGNIYKIVKIGNQWWMAENLRFKSDSGCWWYEEYPGFKKLFGGYYSFEVAKKVCPAGWHLPSDEEWQVLVDTLGGEKVAGGKLKLKSVWMEPNAGATNETGFSAVPGGFRDLDSTFVMPGYIANYWTSTPTTWRSVYIRAAGHDNPGMGLGDYKPASGVNVRCIRD